MSEPVRTCVACRTRRPQRSLVRLRRRSDGVVVPSMGRRASGRSAYLCARRACFEQALRRRALERALGKRPRNPRGAVTVLGPAIDVLWPQVVAAIDHEIQKMKRSGDIRRSPRHDAFAQLRRGLHEPGRSA